MQQSGAYLRCDNALAGLGGGSPEKVVMRIVGIVLLVVLMMERRVSGFTVETVESSPA